MIIGIDEVGRGPIAGPVCLCAFGWRGKHADLRKKIREVKRKIKLELRDSKQLSRTQREAWLVEIKKWRSAGDCDFSLTFVQAPTIDRIGIAPSIRRALSRSLYKISPAGDHRVLLDGGLHAPAEFTNQKSIIKGDEKEPVIALASIVAKVYRDALMTRLAKKHPNYGFEKHVGYGTRAHYAAIKKYGRTSLHRISFLSKIV